MVFLRAIPRTSFALILSALIIAASISFAAVYTARSDHHDQTFYACLYAGALSQVGTAPPANCGRGTQIQWTSAVEVQAPTYVMRSASASVNAGESASITAFCEPGEIATGGGFESADWSFVPANNHLVTSSRPTTSGTDSPESWTVRVVNHGLAPHTISAVAVCMSWNP